MSSKSKEDRSQLLSGLIARKPVGGAAAIPGATADKDRVKPASITTMGASIRELGALGRAAQNAEIGGAVIEIDPSDLDSSLVRDRIDASIDPSFEDLVTSIGSSGQQVPILVRRHPVTSGRFQIAYGHRRARAAERLGIKVKAIVKALSDAELVIAQGKENLERRDLSFIEKAMFARRLEEQGFERTTIIAALSTDKGDLSRYISLAREFDADLLQVIGPAPKAGRPRWQSLAKALAAESGRTLAQTAIQSSEFKVLDSDGRFAFLLRALSDKSARAKPVKEPAARSYKLDQAVLIQRDDGRTIIIVDEIANPCFGDFLAERLREIYAEFLKTEKGEVPSTAAE